MWWAPGEQGPRLYPTTKLGSVYNQPSPAGETEPVLIGVPSTSAFKRGRFVLIPETPQGFDFANRLVVEGKVLSHG